VEAAADEHDVRVQRDARLLVAQRERPVARRARTTAERFPLTDERPREPECEHLLADPRRALEAIRAVDAPARERTLDGLDGGRLAPNRVEAHRGSSKVIAGEAYSKAPRTGARHGSRFRAASRRCRGRWPGLHRSRFMVAL